MSDLIDRQAAIDTVRELLKKNTTVAIRVMYEIERLSSAQPEKSTEKRTETHACDLISRQAAIDAIDNVDWYSQNSKGEMVSGARFKHQAWYKANDIYKALEDLPSAQPEPQWIACSEKLPEDSGRYIISVLDGVGRRTTVAPYQPRYKVWTMTGRMAYWKVIAWMPLPEPYEPEE